MDQALEGWERKLTKVIVSALVHDIQDRKGMLDDVDDDIQKEIISTWEEIVLQNIQRYNRKRKLVIRTVNASNELADVGAKIEEVIEDGDDKD